MSYAILAPVYDRLGMSQFAQQMTPRLVQFAQQNEWLGRRILDLGCGTGAVTAWFAGHGYNVTGVDASEAMLAQARQTLETRSLSSEVRQMDIRHLDLSDSFDMVIGLDVMNELESVRELEAVFKQVYALLRPERWFIFDLHTIQGLVERGEMRGNVLHDDDSLVVFARPGYDFERQIYSVMYDLFQQTTDGLYRREEAARTLRAYPVQAVAALLRRQQFEVFRVLNPDLQPVDLGHVRTSRVIFCVRRL